MDIIHDTISTSTSRADVVITTFGYGHGPAPEAGITLDLRAHFRDPQAENPALRMMTAEHEVIRAMVLTTPGIQALVDATTAAVLAYLAGSVTEPVTVAVGCTGGRHRAPTVGAHLARALTTLWSVPTALIHRDIDKPVIDRPTPTASTWRKSSHSKGGDCVEVARLLPGGGCHCCGGDGTMGGATCSVCGGTGQCGGGR